MALISRDPFSRSELHCERVYVTNTHFGECYWCGAHNKTPLGRRYLLRYRREYDSGRKAEIRGLFCSVSCMRSSTG